MNLDVPILSINFDVAMATIKFHAVFVKNQLHFFRFYSSVCRNLRICTSQIDFAFRFTLFLDVFNNSEIQDSASEIAGQMLLFDAIDVIPCKNGVILKSQPRSHVLSLLRESTLVTAGHVSARF